ncbi:MAG: hypothetical protein RSF40_11550 [Oscillospiraceae bacterium]
MAIANRGRVDFVYAVYGIFMGRTKGYEMTKGDRCDLLFAC